MHLLLTNDDGIHAKGLQLLAANASKLVRITIVAPSEQMSATSQGITLRNSLTVTRVSYPVQGVKAYAVSGTPADCVKVALSSILKHDLPDYIFSGINHGLNTGYDIEYSGTVAAAMEGLLYGIPSCAWSLERKGNEVITETAETYLLPLMEDILASPLRDAIWNVNFPNCPIDSCKGLLADRVPAHTQLIRDGFGLVPGHPTGTEWDSTPVDEVLTDIPVGKSAEVWNIGSRVPASSVADGTDLSAVLHGYVSVGSIHSRVLIQ